MTGTELVFGSYNLEAGGIDGGDDSRLRRQLSMLAAAGADVWALQECKGWTADGDAALLLAERMLGMRGFLVPSRHHGCDLAVFVRQSPSLVAARTRHDQGPQFWHAVACVTVEIRGAGLLDLASAHFAPSSPEIRVAEAESFRLIAGDRPLIAGGDWNAVPAGDPDPPAGGIDAGHLRRKLDRRASEALGETGFTDVAATVGDLSPTVGHGSDKLAYRCDGFRTTLPAAAITGYKVIAEDDPQSDHSPVVAVFNVGYEHLAGEPAGSPGSRTAAAGGPPASAGPARF